MSTFVGVQESQGAWERLLRKPLDQAVWHAWEARGPQQERRSNAVLSKVVKWLSIAGLLAAGGLWSQPAPYDVVVKFVVAGGAMAALLQAFRTWQHTAGDWQRAVAIASIVPFDASLAWRNERPAAQ